MNKYVLIALLTLFVACSSATAVSTTNSSARKSKSAVTAKSPTRSTNATHRAYAANAAYATRPYLANAAYANTVSIANVTFEITATTQIHIRGEQGATVANILPGDILHVAYHRNGNVFVADRISDVGAQPPVHHASATPHHHRTVPAAASNELHAHGVVKTIDPQSGIFVLTEHHHRRA